MTGKVFKPPYITPEAEVQEELALDLHVYGCCYWKIIDGRKVRVHPHDVRYIKGEPRDSSNTVVSSAARTANNPGVAQ